MTLKPIEHDTLLIVKNYLAFTNIVYLDAEMHNSVIELWNDYSNFDPDPELLQLKRLIFYATSKSEPSYKDYKLEFSNANRESIMKKLLVLDLRSITEIPEDEDMKFKKALDDNIREQEKLERKWLKAGEDHNLVEVVIDDEVNFKMQISKGDKLTLEITDQGVTKVSLNATEPNDKKGKINGKTNKRKLR